MNGGNFCLSPTEAKLWSAAKEAAKRHDEGVRVSL